MSQLDRIEKKLDSLVSQRFCDERHNAVNSKQRQHTARIIGLEHGQQELSQARAGLLGSWRAVVIVATVAATVAGLVASIVS